MFIEFLVHSGFTPKTQNFARSYKFSTDWLEERRGVAFNRKRSSPAIWKCRRCHVLRAFSQLSPGFPFAIWKASKSLNVDVPVTSYKTWLTGSQGCERFYRTWQSMRTSTELHPLWTASVRAKTRASASDAATLFWHYDSEDPSTFFANPAQQALPLN